MAAQTINASEKTERKPFASLQNVIGQKEGELFGVKISDIPKHDIENLERGNFTSKLYELTYGENKKAEGRLKLVADRKTGHVKAEFLMKLSELQKRDWLAGGYKLSDEEKTALYEKGESIVYHNKIIVGKRGDDIIRAEKPGEYISKVDPETNQVVTRNLNHPLTFKVPGKLYGAELSEEQKNLLRKGKPISIVDPVIQNKEYKGVATITYDPIRNNIVVKGDNKLKESFAVNKKGNSETHSKSENQKAPQATTTAATNNSATKKQATTVKNTNKASKPKLSM